MRWQSIAAYGALLAGLSACSPQNIESGGDAGLAAARPAMSAPSLPAPGGVIRHGDSFATMASQYASRPVPGPVAATGASAWVAPAPAPAFVASGPPPPADPPPQPPAAVANRQPSPPAAAAPAADVTRPEAAAPDAPAAAAPNPTLRTAGLALFNATSCGTCHAFADAGASGAIGPSLDGNPRLSKAFAVDVMSNGRGAMPSFAGQLSDAEIATLADYLVAFSRQ